MDDQAFAPLAALRKRTAIVEMGHIEKQAERVLLLNGDVNMTAWVTGERATALADSLARAATSGRQSAREDNQSADARGANAHAVSKQMFESLFADEEGRFDTIHKQLDNIQRFGPDYPALHSFESGSAEKKREAQDMTRVGAPPA